jgi:predicted AlkP superfamily phosphohydrolase/phosphomutase
MDLRKKALVVGLDGVPYTLLNNYVERGLMPNLKRIFSEGFGCVQMNASIPDVSSTSWTSFMTGVNPGEHGIYGFMELKDGAYKLSFPNFGDVQAPPIWDIIGRNARGRTSTLHRRYAALIDKPLRSIVLNIPQTYPAMPLNGILTAGFVCPDLRKGTYPDAAYDYLKSIGYMPDVDAAKAAVDPDAFFEDVFSALDKRAAAFEHFMGGDEWDLFIGVITETDRVHHFFFDAAMDESNLRHAVFLMFYRKIDEVIGRLYDRFMESTGRKGLFMTMSDHGFTVIKDEVYLNTWLKENGFLSLNKDREYFEQIEAGTRAFALDPARIYVHLEGRYPLGSVKAPGREAVMDELKAGLLGLTDSGGSPVIKRVYDKAELYRGGALGKAPDLVCIAHDGFDLKGNIKKDGVFGRSHFRGMHTRHDAHCVMPAGLGPEGRLHIEDLAGIVLDRFAGV